jgi:hypothetical protein
VKGDAAVGVSRGVDDACTQGFEVFAAAEFAVDAGGGSARDRAGDLGVELLLGVREAGEGPVAVASDDGSVYAVRPDLRVRPAADLGG